MSLEHRYSARHPVHFAVDLIYRGRRLPTARACDIALEGMRVAVTGITLPTGTPVELAFRRWGREWLIPAVVVHMGGGSVGLMFREPQAVLYHNELDAPRPAPVQPPPVAVAASRIGL